ncbi:MAG: GNAT family N-acetyltransferase [Nocardioidaceae bacterium]
MIELSTKPYLRTIRDGDEALLYDVFASNWEAESAALPDQALVTHFLRIQYTAEKTRLATRYPRLERYIIMSDDEPVGRLFVQQSVDTITCVDVTLLPKYRCQGIGRMMLNDLTEMAADTGKVVTVRVPRRNCRAMSLYTRVGFRMATMDDTDVCFEWSPDRA